MKFMIHFLFFFFVFLLSETKKIIAIYLLVNADACNVGMPCDLIVNVRTNMDVLNKLKMLVSAKEKQKP